MSIVGTGMYVLGPCTQPVQQLRVMGCHAAAMPHVRVARQKAMFPICRSYSDCLQPFEEVSKIFVKNVQTL